MLSANELRIGNYLQGYPLDIPKIGLYHDGVTKITSYGIMMIESGNITSFLPIPLTPEILEKCGFEWSIYHQAWHKQGFVFDLSERSVGGFWIHKSRIHSEIICPEIKHIHQLQNLYFSLTGEELTFKP